MTERKAKTNFFSPLISLLFILSLNDEGPRTLKHFFDKRTVKEPSSETLLCQAEPVLSLSRFSFGVTYYKQINDVAMGTKMRPSYANLFVGFIEHQFSILYNSRKPELCGCCIDDCIATISSTIEELT